MPEADLAAVQTLAELVLAARRLGCTVRVDPQSPELRDLIVLAGLGDLILDAPVPGRRPESPGRRARGAGDHPGTTR